MKRKPLGINQSTGRTPKVRGGREGKHRREKSGGISTGGQDTDAFCVSNGLHISCGVSCVEFLCQQFFLLLLSFFS